MGLRRQEERVIFQLDHFHNPSIRRNTGKRHPRLTQHLTVIIVDLIPMAMTLMNGLLAVQLVSLCILIQNTRIRTKPQGTADILDSILIRHQMNHRMRGIGIQLHTVGVLISDDMAGKLHNGHLHTQAQPQERNIIFTGIADGADLTLDTAIAEAARHQNTVHIGQILRRIGVVDQLGIHPFQIYHRVAGDTAVLQGLHHTDVSVMQLDIFSNDGNMNLGSRMAKSFHHRSPVRQIRFRTGKVQTFAGHLRQMLLLHSQRSLVEILHIQVLKHMGAGHITEQGNFVLQMVVQRMFAPADDNIRPDPHTLQILHRSLGRLGLQLAGRLNIRNQGHMNQNRVLMAHIVLELTDRLQKRLTLNIADGAAHLNDGNMGLILIEIAVKTALNFVGNMGDNLHRASAVIAAALLVQNRPVDFTGSNVGIFRQRFIDKALIVTEIQVGLSAVVRHEHLAVLNGIHRTGVDIDIGVKLLHGHLVAPGFQKTAQRSGSNTLTETRDHSAGDKDVFNRHVRYLLQKIFNSGITGNKERILFHKNN
ncbi:Uncharacterised protein [uncultured Clostridium sp.]|nr:Uncharacterised protein [uncultured Clostridium sp.]